jgi:hypothetical protein
MINTVIMSDPKTLFYVSDYNPCFKICYQPITDDDIDYDLNCLSQLNLERHVELELTQ